MGKPFLIIIDVVERGTELVVVQAIGRQIFDDDALQFLQFLIHLDMVFGEGLYVESGIGITIYKCLNIREYHLFLVLHVVGDAMGIVIIEFEDETSEIVLFVESLHKFLSDERQLEVDVVGMGSLEIMQKRRQRQAVGIVVLLIAIDGKVDHRQESIGIHLLLLTYLLDCLVAEAQVDAEATEALQYVVIVTNDADHLVVSFIHLLILHLSYLILDKHS